VIFLGSANIIFTSPTHLNALPDEQNMLNSFRKLLLKRKLKRQTEASFQARTTESPILANAWRLAQDCDLLYRNKRYATALALAVIALEEVGKYLLTYWEQMPISPGVGDNTPFTYDKKRDLHKTKQVAIVALAQTVTVRASYKKEKIDFQNLNEEQTRRLIKILKESQKKHETFVALVCNKIYERVKWSGLYYDIEMAAKGIEPSIITGDAASEMMGLLANSLHSVIDDGTVYISRYAFPAVLEQWESLLAKHKESNS
jgi:AbiV family abortive infection protein